MDADREAQLLHNASLATGLYIDELDVDQVGDERLHQEQLLAGALWEASIFLTDTLFHDLRTGEGRGQGSGATYVLSRLPDRHADLYGAAFTQRLVVAFADLTGRLTRGWEPPACPAQRFLLTVLLDEVEAIAAEDSVSLPPRWRAPLEADRPERSADLERVDFTDWFDPYSDDSPLPPYVLESPPVAPAPTAELPPAVPPVRWDEDDRY